MRAIFRIAIVQFLPFPLKYGAESAPPKAPLALHKGLSLCYTPRQSTGGIWSPDVFLRFQPGRRMDWPTTEIGAESTVQVLVRDNNVDQALRALKKKMQREGIFREMKMRRNYEKPSERKAREKAEAVRRHRKLLRKRLEREGY
jgi:small subunit ribosomal protein S21